MSHRSDTSPLAISDRIYLVEEAMNMIEEGITDIHLEAIEEGVSPTDEDLMDSLDDLRTSAYVSLLHTMINSKEEAETIVWVMKLKAKELDEHYES